MAAKGQREPSPRPGSPPCRHSSRRRLPAPPARREVLTADRDSDSDPDRNWDIDMDCESDSDSESATRKATEWRRRHVLVFGLFGGDGEAYHVLVSEQVSSGQLLRRRKAVTVTSITWKVMERRRGSAMDVVLIGHFLGNLVGSISSAG